MAFISRWPLKAAVEREETLQHRKVAIYEAVRDKQKI